MLTLVRIVTCSIISSRTPSLWRIREASGASCIPAPTSVSSEALSNIDRMTNLGECQAGREAGNTSSNYDDFQRANCLLVVGVIV